VVVNRSPGEGFDEIDPRSGARTQLMEAGKDAVISPDGQAVAFVIDRLEGVPVDKQIWLFARGYRQSMPIADGSFPSWSPKNAVYFQDPSNRALMVLDTEGEQARPKTFFGRTPGPHPAVSPDDKRIACGQSDGLTILDSSAGKVLLYWPAPGRPALLPSWSPDGSMLAFSSVGDDPLGVWVLDLELRRAVRVSDRPSSTPAWTPDGRWLTYDRTPGVIASIWRVSTGEIRRQMPQGLVAGEFSAFCRAIGQMA
jgi:Tol biopolymer transport system component